MVVDTLIVLSVWLTVPTLLWTLWLIYKLGDWWGDPFGRLVFGSLASLKLWVVGFLGYVAIGTLVGGIPRPTRQVINLAFAAAILAHSILVAVGLYRYTHQQGTLNTSGNEQPQEEADGQGDLHLEPVPKPD